MKSTGGSHKLKKVLAIGIVVLLLLCLVMISPALGYTISGYTKLPSDSPIQNVYIENNITSDTNYTDTDGFYLLTLPNGTYQITASKAGYVTNSILVTVSGVDVTNANITVNSLYTDYELEYHTLFAIQNANSVERGGTVMLIFLVLLLIDFGMILFFFGNTRNRIYGNVAIGLLTVFLTFILAHHALLYPVEMPDLSLFLNGIALVMLVFSILIIVEIVIEKMRKSVS